MANTMREKTAAKTALPLNSRQQRSRDHPAFYCVKEAPGFAPHHGQKCFKAIMNGLAALQHLIMKLYQGSALRPAGNKRVMRLEV